MPHIVRLRWSSSPAICTCTQYEECHLSRRIGHLHKHHVDTHLATFYNFLALEHTRITIQIEPSETRALRRFFDSNHYLVVGASKDRTKFGNKVLRWYIHTHLPVTPVHPELLNIEGISTITDVGQAIAAQKTSLSIVTPPRVTLSVLQKYVNSINASAFWLQPGSADTAVTLWIHQQPSHIQDKIIYTGSCILVHGSGLLRGLERL